MYEPIDLSGRVQILFTNDFSVAYVAQHSNSRLPLAYRVAGVWGGHEGSLLLWTLMLAFPFPYIATTAFAVATNEIHCSCSCGNPEAGQPRAAVSHHGGLGQNAYIWSGVVIPMRVSARARAMRAAAQRRRKCKRSGH